MILKQSIATLSNKERFTDFAIREFESHLPSRNSIKKAIKEKRFRLEGNVAQTGDWVLNGALVELHELESSRPLPYSRKIEIVFEDEYFAIVVKPAGMPVSGNSFKTIQNAILGQVTDSTLPDALPWPRPVHRLDSPTSGLLIIAKTVSSHAHFTQSFEERNIKKTYAAIVIGKLESTQGSIDQDLEEQKAITDYRVTKEMNSLSNGHVSLLEVHPQTGRTHQIRKHLRGIGHPIMGDPLYGDIGTHIKGKGLFLSAVELEFEHPHTKALTSFKQSLPKKFESLLEREQNRWDKFKD